jgi:hypothetical protein
MRCLRWVGNTGGIYLPYWQRLAYAAALAELLLRLPQTD